MIVMRMVRGADQASSLIVLRCFVSCCFSLRSVHHATAGNCPWRFWRYWEFMGHYTLSLVADASDGLFVNMVWDMQGAGGRCQNEKVGWYGMGHSS